MKNHMPYIIMAMIVTMLLLVGGDAMAQSQSVGSIVKDNVGGDAKFVAQGAQIIFAAIGFIFLGIGFVKIYKASKEERDMGKAIVTTAVGACLFALSLFVNPISQTIFKRDASATQQLNLP